MRLTTLGWRNGVACAVYRLRQYGGAGGTTVRGRRGGLGPAHRGLRAAFEVLRHHAREKAPMPGRLARRTTPRALFTLVLVPVIGVGLLLLGGLGPAAAQVRPGAATAAPLRGPVATVAPTAEFAADGGSSATGFGGQQPVVTGGAVEGGEEDAPLALASDSARATGWALPWVLAVLALAVVAGSVRAYTRSPQRQAARAARTPR